MEQEMNHRGIYEKLPGSGVWWVRHLDAQGLYPHEKGDSKSAAILFKYGGGGK